MAQLVVAAVLLGSGEIVRRTAHIQERLATAEEDLAMLALDAADAEYAGLEEEVGLTARVPIVGPRLLADIRQAHDQLAYWRGAYRNVPREAELMAADATADRIFLAANAAFRNGSSSRRGQA